MVDEYQHAVELA